MVTNKEDLSHYVSRIMKLKGLTQRDVQQQSGGRITNGYVASIITGRAKNPSIEKLQALAKGLGVDVDELMHVACGRTQAQLEGLYSYPSHPLVLLELIRKIVVSPDIIEILNEVVKLSPEDRAVMLKSARSLNKAGQELHRRRESA